MRTGDRVDVVLDVITEGNDYRVVMVGVFAPEDHAKIPARDPRAARNVVQTWLGTPHSFGAFRMGHTMPSSEDSECINCEGAGCDWCRDAKAGK